MKILENNKYTVTTGTLDDFKRYFQDRYNKTRKIILKEHNINPENLKNISTIKKYADYPMKYMDWYTWKLFKSTELQSKIIIKYNYNSLHSKEKTYPVYIKINNRTQKRQLTPKELAQVEHKVNKILNQPKYKKQFQQERYNFVQETKAQLLKRNYKGEYEIIDVTKDNILLKTKTGKKIASLYKEETYENLKELYNRTIQQEAIVTIQDKRKTKYGQTILTIEDKTGSYTVTCNPGKYNDIPDSILDGLVTDETIYIKIDTLPKKTPRKTDEKIGITRLESITMKNYVSDIIEPDIQPKRNNINKDLHLVFLSDIHVGSKKFADKMFTDCISYINNNQVDAVLIAGDLVDGIGIYPNQEEELEIPDIYQQYQTLSEYLEKIQVPIIISPGNHDATRLAEPQPKIPEKYAKPLYKQENITMLSNPSMIEIKNVKIKMYHGESFTDLIQKNKQLSFEKPCNIMKQQLIKRNTTPIYGLTTPISPEPDDPLVIDTVPDIYHTGHIHVTQIDHYKGVKLVNSGTFQHRTNYQEYHKINPTTGLVPILKNGIINTKQF